jgi:hypothetical protein
MGFRQGDDQACDKNQKKEDGTEISQPQFFPAIPPEAPAGGIFPVCIRIRADGWPGGEKKPQNRPALTVVEDCNEDQREKQGQDGEDPRIIKAHRNSPRT